MPSNLTLRIGLTVMLASIFVVHFGYKGLPWIRKEITSGSRAWASVSIALSLIMLAVVIAGIVSIWTTP